MIKVSIIIPTWNREDRLIEAVKSVQNQTINNVEILICDDGSYDNSKKKVQELNDNRIKWIDGKHSGKPAVPRNCGINHAKGEWLAFLDSDDIWHKDKLELQLLKANQTSMDVICTNAVDAATNTQIIDNIYEDKVIKLEELLERNLIITSSLIVKKNIVQNLRFNESNKLRGIEDYEFWLSISSQNPFFFLNKNLVIYSNNSVDSIRKQSLHPRIQRINVVAGLIKRKPKNLIIILYKIIVSQIKIEIKYLKTKYEKN